MRERLPILSFACAAAALAVAATPRPASAYPSSVIFAPSGESLGFGAFVLGGYAGMAVNPEPVRFSSGWGGIQVGLVPSFDIAGTGASALAFGGAEIGFDVYGPDTDADATAVFNAKIQLVAEQTYWPAIAIGLFQVSPSAGHGAMLGYLALSKSFTIGKTELGQLTFGLMRSFQSDSRVSPRCLAPGMAACLFRGSAPFEDENAGIFGGYVSPWLGPVSFSFDHVGGTSAVSSTNVGLNVRFWKDGDGGYAAASVGGFFTNDRREPPAGPGYEDGLFVTIVLASSLGALFGVDLTTPEAPARPSPPAPSTGDLP